MAKTYATGRRKASIAKVWLTPGSGNITVNGLSLDAWLGGLEAKKLRVKQPLALTKQDGSVDIVAKTLGGFSGELGESIPQLKELGAAALQAGEGITFIAERFKGIK